MSINFFNNFLYLAVLFPFASLLLYGTEDFVGNVDYVDSKVSVSVPKSPTFVRAPSIEDEEQADRVRRMAAQKKAKKATVCRFLSWYCPCRCGTSR